MSQFGLSTANSHWGYGTAGAYSPYLAGGGLSSCGTPTAAQFNNPALGFSCSPSDQTATQDFGGVGGVVNGNNGVNNTGTGTTGRECVPSKIMRINEKFILFNIIMEIVEFQCYQTQQRQTWINI